MVNNNTMSGEEASSTALVYETTERAILLLRGAGDRELSEAREAATEAAYYLSDTLEPDERADLLALAQDRGAALAEESDAARATRARKLLDEVAGEVARMLLGRSASSELHIALRALRRAIGGLAGDEGRAQTGPEARGVRVDRRGMLRRRHSRQG